MNPGKNDRLIRVESVISLIEGDCQLIGKQILAKMLPLPEFPVPLDFGVKINQSNIESHLEHIRSERELYRGAHPQELALLEKWFGPGCAKALELALFRQKRNLEKMNGESRTDWQPATNGG